MRRPRQTYPPHGRAALAVTAAALAVSRTVRNGNPGQIAQALTDLDRRSQELRDELAGDVVAHAQSGPGEGS